MSYFLALRVPETHLNPYGLKPISRMIYPTKREATMAAYWKGIASGNSPIAMDADHEPGRTIISTLAGPS